MAHILGNNFMLYWRPDTADSLLKKEELLDYVTSDQLGRVSQGDTIWVVTVKKGGLYLLGKVTISDVTSREIAIRRLRRSSVWGNKKYYAIAMPGTAEALKEISLRDVAGRLVFQSASTGSNRLHVDHEGKVNAQQLQTMRVLDETSVDLLQRIWSTW